ncbi:MAG: Stk1 family PASTA domain-containing Ser/Thr kinase [Lachnospiraceae bacterium]|nr:Stk1 family PASTA domain-containing Ser/Thr kinase [Lachnospiraceae bacterium]
MLKEGIIIGDRYEIISRIGSGGMADVYKAKDHKLSRMVAVKVLKAEFRADTTFVSKFQKEAQAAAGLSHPNVVNIYDVGEDRGLYYIVMELVEGITLKDYITKKGKLSVKEATSIAIQVSLGLEAAHNEGIVHRDVKPQNIIISTDGKVKLSDFGIAKAINSNTITANVMGSVHYSSPEQVRGGFSDTKSDIYSLGITMYEMVTGRVPFDGDTTVAIAIKHLQEELIPPSRFTPDLPFSLEQIIMKCTQKNPERRYPYIGDLIEDLKKSLVDPQGNFVQLTPLNNNARTVMATAAETAAVRKAAKKQQPQPKQQKPTKTTSHKDPVSPYLEEDEEEYTRSDKKRDYDDGTDVVSSKLEKAITIGGFLIGAVIIVILIVVIGNMAGLFNKKSSQSNSASTSVSTAAEEEDKKTEEKDQEAAATVECPDFFKMTLAEAQETANSHNIGAGQIGTQESTEVPEGRIISQEIKPGTKIEPGTRVGVVISSGSNAVTVPSNLVGITQDEAISILAAAELGATVVPENSETVPEGHVIAVNPVEGTGVLPGTAVTLTVSAGSASGRVTIPDNLVGADQATAVNTLAGLGLQASVSTSYDAAYPEGAVIAVNPAAGTQVEAGSTVALTVNQAPSPDSYVCAAAIQQPGSYTGGEVTLVLEQNPVTTTIYTGADPFTGGVYNTTIYGLHGYPYGYLHIYENGALLDTVLLEFSPQ